MLREEGRQLYMELKNIDKSFGVTQALRRVDMRIYSGEVIGLVGPNGAGKSTLIKVIAGVFPPTAGEICVRGEAARGYSVKDAQEIGISCAYQDLSLCANLAVYENFAMLTMPHGLLSAPGWRSRKKREAKDLLERYFPGNGIDVMKSVNTLSLAERQIVEICKALMTEGLKILVLDEPTSALSTDRAKQLRDVVRHVSANGVAVIYISHKLDEIRQVSDRIVLMRNGEVAGERAPNETTADELVKLLGGEVKERCARSIARQGSRERIVEIDGLYTNHLRDIRLHADKGEILGISGLAGSGQAELLSEIFDAGNRRGNRKALRIKTLRVYGSVSYVSGDRAKEGVFRLWSILDNILIASLDQVKSGVFLSREKSETLARRWYDKLKFKAENLYSPIVSLSGGNQQKALIARGIACGADLILLNDPTAGVDIETKQEIYALLQEAKSEGKTVILYSTEDAEMEICDRVYVMRDGAMTGQLEGEEITVPNIVQASFRDVEEKPRDGSQRSRLFGLLASRMLLPIATLLFMIGANAWLNPKILSYASVRMLVGTAVPLVFASLGQMFVVAAGDIDMGNGYSIGLVNVLVGVVLTQSPLMGIVSLLVFVLAYVLMGALIHIRRIPAIVVTLGAQFLWLGMALVISPTPGGSCPAWLSALYRWGPFSIPMPVVLCVLAGAACHCVLYRSKYGMILRGIGSNPEAVERSGWSYLAAKMTNYGLAALMVVLAGTTFTAVCLGADANAAASYCMMSIATVILGGCEMAGGIVEPIGVAAGGIAMSLITTLLIFMKIGSNYQTAVMGLILISVLVVKLFLNQKRGVRA
ncbi:MAG: ATP-binding cassette domain-containing protein [Synergistaceae bacterium]|jgi:ribose transport system ATP-binding protein|nr:ATP-binding cassette domain-containing protein [Synergistaceae bacterium]